MSGVVLFLFRLLAALLVAIMLMGLTGWGALAIYYGDSQGSLLQTILASAFVVAGVITLICGCSRRWRWRAVVVFLALFSVQLGWWLTISPSNDREWAEEVAKLAYAEIDGDQVTLHNIRNFEYRSETDFTPAYYDRTYDLGKIDSVDVFVVYWMGPAIAHTMVSFGFGGEDYLAVSIEARKERGEGYSTIKGFFRQYEEIHIVADERDVVGLRTNFRQDPPEHVYRYRINGTPELARRFFLSYLDAINDRFQQPQFYNTLLANCTNVIWKHARVNPERLPFSWEILVSGYAPGYLYEMDKLDSEISFTELTQRGYVNPVALQLGAIENFSQAIRTQSSQLAIPPIDNRPPQ